MWFLIWAVLFVVITPYGLSDWESWLLIGVGLIAIATGGTQDYLVHFADTPCGTCGEDLFDHVCPEEAWAGAELKDFDDEEHEIWFGSY